MLPELSLDVNRFMILVVDIRVYGMLNLAQSPQLNKSILEKPIGGFL